MTEDVEVKGIKQQDVNEDEEVKRRSNNEDIQFPLKCSPSEIDED